MPSAGSVGIPEGFRLLRKQTQEKTGQAKHIGAASSVWERLPRGGGAFPRFGRMNRKESTWSRMGIDLGQGPGESEPGWTGDVES